MSPQNFGECRICKCKTCQEEFIRLYAIIGEYEDALTVLKEIMASYEKIPPNIPRPKWWSKANEVLKAALPDRFDREITA